MPLPQWYTVCFMFLIYSFALSRGFHKAENPPATQTQIVRMCSYQVTCWPFKVASPSFSEDVRSFSRDFVRPVVANLGRGTHTVNVLPRLGVASQPLTLGRDLLQAPCKQFHARPSLCVSHSPTARAGRLRNRDLTPRKSKGS